MKKNIKIVKNVLKLQEFREYSYDNVSLFDILLINLRNEIDSGFKVVVLVNKKLIKTVNYDKIITIDDDVEIIVKQNATLVVNILINLVISFVLGYLLNKFFGPDSQKTKEVSGGTVYTQKDSQMRAKNQEPIPEIFGTFKIYPSLIAPPLYRYENNDQYIYMTALIGKGEYTFENAFITDTKISDLVLSNNRECENLVDDAVINCLTKKTDLFKCVRIEPNSYTINKFEDKFFAETADSKYRFLTYENENIQSFSLLDFDPTASHILTEAVCLNKDENIDKIEIDVVASNGLYGVNDTGEPVNATISFFYRLFYYDNLGNRVNYTSGFYTKTSMYSTPIRDTIEITVATGKTYYIEFYNNTVKSNPGDNINNTYIIERIKSFITRDEIQNYTDSTCVIFRLKACAIFSQQNNLKLGLRVKRKNINTLADAIKYIWGKAGYDYLELGGAELITQYTPINCIFEEKLSVFDALNSVLRPRDYTLIPTITGYEIKKDEKRNVLTYIFDKNNIKKDSLKITYNFSSIEENDSFASVYIDENGDNQTVIYPVNGETPDENILIGITNYEDAATHAKLGYNKKLYQVKLAEFSTELEGFIPEIDDKIGIAEYYINDSYSSSVIDINTADNSLILETEIYLNDTEENFCIIRSENTNLDNYVKIINTEKYWTNKIYFDIIEFDVATLLNLNYVAVIVGTEEIGIKEYIVKKIEPISDNEIKISAQNYDERMYN